MWADHTTLTLLCWLTTWRWAQQMWLTHHGSSASVQQLWGKDKSHGYINVWSRKSILNHNVHVNICYNHCIHELASVRLRQYTQTRPSSPALSLALCRACLSSRSCSNFALISSRALLSSFCFFLSWIQLWLRRSSCCCWKVPNSFPCWRRWSSCCFSSYTREMENP